MKDAMEGREDVRAEGAAGREGRVAAVKELVACGNPKTSRRGFYIIRIKEINVPLPNIRKFPRSA
jgi:hypothetical protein